MKVLFDEDVPAKLARSLPRHDIHTVVSMGWGGIKNGALLALIEQERFDVFLTGDKNMDKQQRLEGRPFAVLVMSAINWCQRKVERSYSLQSRNVRFWLRLEKMGVSLAVPVKRRRAMLASNPIEE